MGFVALMHMPETEVRQTLSGYVTATGGGELVDRIEDGSLPNMLKGLLLRWVQK